MAEPPIQSPKPDVAPDAGRHDTGEMPVTRGVMKKAFRLNEIYTVLVAVLTAGGALIGGYKLFISEARAAGEEAAKEAKKTATEALNVATETRQDIRALYNFQLTGRRQERLENPPEAKDGGK